MSALLVSSQFFAGLIVAMVLVAALYLCVPGLAWGEEASGREPATRLIERVAKPADKRLPEISLFLLLPEGLAEEESPRGVLAYCTWEDSAEDIRANLGGGGGDITSRRMVDYARGRKLAVLTWTAERTWDSRLSADEIERQEAQWRDELFTLLSREWRRMAGRLSATYGLPKDGWLLFGISRGAQWAHRLAMREPRFFKAVHIAINSSYDKPSPAAANVWWLATTGELEVGYPAAQRWLRQCEALGYRIVLRAAPNTGHAMTEADWELGEKFFDFALSGREWKNEFAGDLVNHVVVPASRAESVPEAQRVWLPDKAMAEAYGSQAE